MHVVDAVLGPIVWGVPYNDLRITTRLKRKIYCMWNAQKIRMFYFGMLAMDKHMAEEDKAGYYAWLRDVEWHKLLASTFDKAHWKRRVDKISDPVAASLRDDYDRLFQCFKMGSNPHSTGVV